MNNKIGFFEEYDGKLSYQRLQSIILLLLFCVVTIYEVYKNQINFEVLTLLAVAAIAPKLLQKLVEKKTGLKMTSPGEIYGCTDPAAKNYDPNATKDNGTCIYLAED